MGQRPAHGEVRRIGTTDTPLGGLDRGLRQLSSVTSVSSGNLRRDVLAIAGIADAEVDTEGPTPVVRVWLDGTREATEVASRIRGLLTRRERSGPGSDHPDPVSVRQQAKRSGLGRGLESLIPPPVEEAVSPPHLRPLRDADDPLQLEAVAVVESAGGVVVTAEDSAGRAAEAQASDRDVDGAVAVAVAAIVGAATPVATTVVAHEAGGVPITTVVVDMPDGTRRVGSVVTGAGRPYTVGRAVWVALTAGSGG